MARTAVVETNWYDQPQYYDLAFRGDVPREVEFVEAACRKYGSREVRRLLEPACGTGRLVVELAARGYSVTGLDLNQTSLDYLRRRLARRNLGAALIHGDMADFHLRRPVDAAYCLLDSFRHLLTEDAARGHLECVARCLRPGGLYILGLHLLPPDASEECTERWTERQGKLQVTSTLRVLATDRRRRLETLRISLLARQGEKERRFRGQFDLRMYTAAQFRRLLASVPSLELCDVYDYWYDIDEPLRLDNQMSDTVFILRKQAGAAG